MAALQPGSPHRELRARQAGEDASHRIRSARLEPLADGERFPVKEWLPNNLGPGRHGCGHNIFAYHRDPDGQIVELFGELDRMQEDLGYFEPRMWHRDRPQVPKVWPADPAASN